MKTLFLADAKPQESLLELAKDCEIIILLGDLFYEWIEELKDINIPIIGINGNHDFDSHVNNDLVSPLEKIGAINLHLNTFTYKGIRFGGFKGDMGYVYAENNAPYWKDPDMNVLRSDLQKLNELEPVDVFITHFPSFGTLDMPHIIGRRGLQVFRNYIDRTKPRYHFHGHMHKPATATIGKTEVTCVYPYLIEEIG